MSTASQFVANRLRAYRGAAGLSQEQAAVLVGVSFKYYQRLESGEVSGIRLSTLEKVVVAYHSDLEAFFSARKPKARKLKALPPPHRRARRRV